MQRVSSTRGTLLIPDLGPPLQALLPSSAWSCCSLNFLPCSSAPNSSRRRKQGVADREQAKEKQQRRPEASAGHVVSRVDVEEVRTSVLLLSLNSICSRSGASAHWTRLSAFALSRREGVEQGAKGLGCSFSRREGGASDKLPFTPPTRPALVGVGAGGSAAAHTSPGPTGADLERAGRLRMCTYQGCG